MVVKLALAAAVLVPAGVFGYHVVQTAVRNETLRSDVRNAINVEAVCNQDRNGAGYSPGSNSAQGGGDFELVCGGTDELVRASSGNELTITVPFLATSYTIAGVQTSTGLHVYYDSATGRWS